MSLIKNILFLLLASDTYCDWVSDWMAPIQSQVYPSRRTNNENDNFKMIKIAEDSSRTDKKENLDPIFFRGPKSDFTSINLKSKLEATLNNAKSLAETLKEQITSVVKREILLKEAITKGRFGVTSVTVTTLGRTPKNYIIRDGSWSLCNGIIQLPTSINGHLFNELINIPRCIGQEVMSSPDQCVFNSVTKYETIPVHRRSEYIENDFLCLRAGFNNTLEQYYSVPQQIVRQTCKDGKVKSIVDNNVDCGVRILSDYSYYPHRSSSAAQLPLEYCTEDNGSCRLIVAWHVSNTTIENFEFLKNEQNFKQFFIKSEPDINNVFM